MLSEYIEDAINTICDTEGKIHICIIHRLTTLKERMENINKQYA